MSDGIKEVGLYYWDGLKWKKWGADITIAGNMIDVDYDYVSVAYPTTSSEVYTFKTGGSGGVTVATITISYTDTTKEYILTVTKT